MLPQGDNDPVDVVEIGSQTCEMGGVYQVKPLGESWCVLFGFLRV